MPRETVPTKAYQSTVAGVSVRDCFPVKQERIVEQYTRDRIGE